MAPTNNPPPLPPQAQAGKFKPRKPSSKKSRSHADTTSSNKNAVTTTPAQPARRGGRGGRRGGRGSGTSGAGRIPIQQGASFFTAQPAATASSSSLAGGNTARNNRRPPQTALNNNTAMAASASAVMEEEIVGMIEARPDGAQSSSSSKLLNSTTTSQGKHAANHADEDQSLLAASALERDETQSGGGTTKGSVVCLESYFSDSDSSREEEEEEEPIAMNSNKKKKTVKKPQESLLFTGPQPMSPVFTRHATSGNETTTAALFSKDKSNDRSLFLMQFPTRLPPVQEQQQPYPTAVASSSTKERSDTAMDIDNEAIHTSTTTTNPSVLHNHYYSKASTAPCDVTAFGNVLPRAVPGRVGKLQILKSGKMRLVLANDDMNDNHDKSENATSLIMVTQGVAPSFRQEAVTVDFKEPLHGSSYTAIGTVQHTLVVTPDLTTTTTNA